MDCCPVFFQNNSNQYKKSGAFFISNKMSNKFWMDKLNSNKYLKKLKLPGQYGGEIKINTFLLLMENQNLK
jgi:hypothetical protein